MNTSRSSSSEPSEALLEIGRRFYPRRRARYRDLRPYQEACEWARTLDWRGNPYERFLLHRELLHYFLSVDHIDSIQKIRRIAAPGEMSAVIDHLLDTLPAEDSRLGIFTRVFLRLPWEIAYRHRLVKYSPLAQALGTLGEIRR